jgi:cytosine/adenosine deaminase-related metal-dependent hydrolase
VVSLAAPHLVPSPDPYAALLFASGASDVTSTIVGGEQIYRRDVESGLFTDADRAVVNRAAQRLDT